MRARRGSPRASIAELRAEQRTFLRENARLREDAHAGLEVSLAAARETFAREAQNAGLSWGVDPRPTREMVELAVRWAASQPGFAQALHDAIDGLAALGAPDFSRLSRNAFEKERDRFRREIAERELVERRAASRRKSEAERELAAVEEKAAAALGNVS